MRLIDKLLRKHVSREPTSANDGRLTYQPEGTSARWYAHALDGYHPAEEAFGFKVDVAHPRQDQIVERLIAYFARLQETMSTKNIGPNADMWSFITASHEPFRQALATKDSGAVSHMLLNVATGPLVAGFMNNEPYDRLVAKAQIREVEAKHFADKLLSLSEALGCSPIQSIEQGEWGYAQIDLAATLSAIRARLGFDVRPPTAGGGSFGYRTDDGIFCIKDLYAIYTAGQVSHLTRDVADCVVAEIGGGTGTLAYYLKKAGLASVRLFDLPIVSVIQGYYLMRSLAPEDVWLHGEPPSDAGVRVHPFWALDDEPDRSVGLFVNQDSLPEIEKSAAMAYLSLFKRKGSAFLSINQEGQAKDQLGNPQSVVFRLCESAGGFERHYRFLHWMRLGYVEEFYRMPRPNA